MSLPVPLVTVGLLIASNLFMTVAWYGHLKFGDRPLYLVILVSWMIALAEYCFAVPANRIGHTLYSAAELKTMQEVITLVVFAVCSSTTALPAAIASMPESIFALTSAFSSSFATPAST